MRCLYSKIYPLLSDTKLTSFLTLNNISMRGLRFESGPNAHYIANSVLPFSTPLAQAMAAVTDCHLQNSRPVNVLYYAVHRFFLGTSSDSILTVLARGKVAATHTLKDIAWASLGRFGPEVSLSHLIALLLCRPKI